MKLTLKTATSLNLPVSVLQGRRKPGDLWLPSDTICALAWQQYSDTLCAGCGQPKTESMDRSATEKYHATALRCHGCESVSKAVDKHKESSWPSALYYSTERHP